MQSNPLQSSQTTQNLKKSYNVINNTIRKEFIERVYGQRKKPIKEVKFLFKLIFQ